MVAQVKEEVVYALGHTDEERRRLIDQDELFRPSTEGLFRTAGIRRGMRVLDVGCGVGDLSMLAASFIGPEGTVIGVDQDARSLALARQRAEERGLRNVSFAEGDVQSISFDHPFDAVVGRFILMYLPDPVAALKHLSALVCSGGLVVFQEYVIKHDGFAAPEPVNKWEQPTGTR